MSHFPPFGGRGSLGTHSGKPSCGLNSRFSDKGTEDQEGFLTGRRSHSEFWFTVILVDKAHSAEALPHKRMDQEGGSIAGLDLQVGKQGAKAGTQVCRSPSSQR